MGKHDLWFERKNTKRIDQKAPFTFVRDHIWCIDAWVLVMNLWHGDVRRRRDPSHELTLETKFVFQKFTGRRKSNPCDSDDVVKNLKISLT